MDAGECGASADDDWAGVGALLRRPRAPEKYPRHHDAKLHAHDSDYCPVGISGLQPVLWRQRAGNWRI